MGSPVAPLANRSADVRPPAQRLAAHMAIAAAGVLTFLALATTSGRIAAGDGLGWDGQSYAGLMAEGLDKGSVISRSRPFLPLVTRIPHALGLDIIPSFQVMNCVYAFTLYLFIALILDLYGAGTRAKTIVIVNVALCIATSKMYAYYAVQIDLGVLALMTAALYFVLTDRHWLAGAVCVMAMASREFGVAVLLCGLHRTFRRGRLWPDALWYLPGVATAVVVRWVTYAEGALTVSSALGNLTLWGSPSFVTAFLYFAITIFGGISALLALHPRWCVARLREEPELATFLAVIVGLSAMGSFDVWRYLVFTLPVAVVLIAQYYRDRVRDLTLERPLAAAMTFATVITQRPFERMDVNLYFQDWFPLYYVMRTPPPELLLLWGMRLLALLLLVITLASIRRSDPRLQDTGA